MRSRWEDIDPRAEGRPARRYYQLTSDGLALARAALARAYTARPTWWAGLLVRTAALPLPMGPA